MFRARQIYRSMDGATPLKVEEVMVGLPELPCIPLSFTLPMRARAHTRLGRLGPSARCPKQAPPPQAPPPDPPHAPPKQEGSKKKQHFNSPKNA